MKPSLIDTDILSEFFRGHPKVLIKIGEYLEVYDSINFSIITYYEILNGLLFKDAKRQLQKFKDFTELNHIVPLSIEAANKAAEIYAQLRHQGKPIGHTDCLIAGIALSNKLQVVTNNTDHFERINDIEVVNWMI